MRERVKIFTFLVGNDDTLAEPSHQEQINEWLSTVKGRVQQISQSESQHSGQGHHVTVCVWYLPDIQTHEHASQ